MLALTVVLVVDNIMEPLQTEKTTTTAATLTVVTMLLCQRYRRLWAEVDNDSDTAISDFDIEIQPHPNAAWTVIATATADYTTDINEPLLGCSTDLASLASGSQGLLWMDIEGMYAVRFKATTGSAGKDITIRATRA